MVTDHIVNSATAHAIASRSVTPEDVHDEEGFVSTPDGHRLHWRSAEPSRPRACLVLVHGLGEHAGRYSHVLAFLAGRGFACHVFDLRGHGRSGGLGGHVDSFDDYLQDLRTVHDQAARKHGGLAVFLLGHSMGGLVALRYAQQRPEGLRGLVLSSPLLGIAPGARPSRPLAALGRLLSRALPRFRLANTVDPARLSRDPAVGAAYARDPLVGRRVSARWFTAALSAMDEAHAGAASLKLPTLVMAAGDDFLADTEATRRFARSAPAGSLELHVWDGFYHELLNAPEKEAVLGRIEGWIGDRLAR